MYIKKRKQIKQIKRSSKFHMVSGSLIPMPHLHHDCSQTEPFELKMLRLRKSTTISWEGPLTSVINFLNHKKRVGRKKRKKHYTQKAKDVLYLPESLGEFQGLGGPGL